MVDAVQRNQPNVHYEVRLYVSYQHAAQYSNACDGAVGENGKTSESELPDRNVT